MVFAPSRWNRLDEVRRASMRCGSANGVSPPRPISVPVRPCEMESSANDRFSFLTSMYCPGDGQSCGMLMPGDRSHNTVSRSGSGYGRGLSKSALTTLKTAVFAPIPIASDATITPVRPAVRLKVRRAYRRSCRKSVIAASMQESPSSTQHTAEPHDARHRNAQILEERADFVRHLQSQNASHGYAATSRRSRLSSCRSPFRGSAEFVERRNGAAIDVMNRLLGTKPMLVEPVLFTDREHVVRRDPRLFESAKRRHLTRNCVVVLDCRDWVHREICEMTTVKGGFASVLCVDRQVV